MIVNAAGTKAVSNLGWIDRGSIWTYTVGENRSRQVTLSDSRGLSIVQGASDYFAVIHEQEDSTARLTVHSFVDVADVISSIELASPITSKKPYLVEAIRLRGNGCVWASLPKAYVVRVAAAPFLLMIESSQSSARLHALPWYEQMYDTTYQGILGVTEVPGSQYLLISIQRDSRPVLYDPTTGNIVEKLNLAGRGGNPQLFFRQGAPELWASDYDTIVKLDSTTWNMLDTLRLQEGQGDTTKLFVGKYGFNSEESLCAVARPYSGDIVAIDTASFRVTLRVQTGAQPEDIGLLREGRVVARDWKTGKLLQGVLQPL